MLLVSDVVAINHSEIAMIANVDLLMMAHRAIFDEDSPTGWAKCHDMDASDRRQRTRSCHANR